MYKLNRSPSDIDYIIKLGDGAYIPLDTENVDYQDYLEWVSEGNTAEPA